jgi:glycosyltransferase involved in cell wall biosynthesis/peptidoglycan/xylan/chitin deacetylase (PgdA/CDA1 family)
VKFSIVIPTYNRRDVVSASILALKRQRFPEPFEVIAVVDGSTDGTATTLRSLEVPFPLLVLEQENKGLSVTRNRGASAARGEFLLFLDDDMEADPDLLAEHDRAHRDGADVVIGHLPLHPDSPDGILKGAVGVWAEERLARLALPGATPDLTDLVGGQLSIRKETFDRVGGFDTGFTRGGTFGNEDIDFGHRVHRLGLRIVFNPRAISWQRYVVRPEQYLRQRYDLGHADVTFARKYPDKARETFRANGAEHWRNRFVWRPMLAIPGIARLVGWMLRGTALALLERDSGGYLARRLFSEASFVEYWSGVRDAGGIPRFDPPRVLAYHSIAVLPPESPLAPYTIPPGVLAKQLDTLLRGGFQFVDADAILNYLRHGRALPSRAVLLTFDDCYTDLVDAALPVLRARRIPAVAFAVSGQIGGVNEWDRKIGAPELRLLDADGLRVLASAGLEIGAHSRTHAMLPRVPDGELPAEVEGAASDIEALGLPRPRLFAYPHGEVDARVEAVLRTSGMDAAFTVEPGPLKRDMNRMLLPRIPIYSTDLAAQFARSLSGASFRERLRRSARVMDRDLRRAWVEIDGDEPMAGRDAPAGPRADVDARS